MRRRRFRFWPCRSATSIATTCSKIGEAVLKVFRDFGNRSDRKRARLKYIIHDWGMPAFRAKVEEYLGHPLADPEAGRRSRASTTTWAGIRRATASSSWAFRSRTAGSRTTATFGWPAGLRAFFEKYKTPARLTCQQSILLEDIEPVAARRDRALAGGIRDRDGRADLDGAAVVDGLPGVADLRLGGHRSRACTARGFSTNSRSSWRGWAWKKNGSRSG